MRALAPNQIGADSCGAVAQLGERCVRNAEVGSSILLRSTISCFDRDRSRRVRYEPHENRHAPVKATVWEITNTPARFNVIGKRLQGLYTSIIMEVYKLKKFSRPWPLCLSNHVWQSFANWLKQARTVLLLGRLQVMWGFPRLRFRFTLRSWSTPGSSIARRKGHLFGIARTPMR